MVCQGLLRAAIFNAEKTLGTRLPMRARVKHYSLVWYILKSYISQTEKHHPLILLVHENGDKFCAKLTRHFLSGRARDRYFVLFCFSCFVSHYFLSLIFGRACFRRGLLSDFFVYCVSQVIVGNEAFYWESINSFIHPINR